MNDWSVIILAAGKGTRLGSKRPKPLVLLGGIPLIQPVILNSVTLNPAKIVVVISDYTKEVATTFPNPILHYLSIEPHGTGYSVAEALKEITTPHVLITQADDSYFYSLETLQGLCAQHNQQDIHFTVGAVAVDYPLPYASIEFQEKRLTALHRHQEDLVLPSPKYIVAGLYAGESDWLRKTLPEVEPSSNQEIGLPSVIDIALNREEPIGAFFIPSGEWQGINTPAELELAEAHLQSRLSLPAS